MMPHVKLIIRTQRKNNLRVFFLLFHPIVIFTVTSESEHLRVCITLE